jgi:hypothetical protein
MKNSGDNIGNRTRDLPACSAVPQPTAPRRNISVDIIIFNFVIMLSNRSKKKSFRGRDCIEEMLYLIKIMSEINSYIYLRCTLSYKGAKYYTTKLIYRDNGIKLCTFCLCILRPYMFQPAWVIFRGRNISA